MRWVWHTSCMGEVRNVYRILVGKPEGSQLRRLGLHGRIILKIDLKDMVDLIHVTQDRVRWRTLVNTVNECLGSMEGGEFFWLAQRLSACHEVLPSMPRSRTHNILINVKWSQIPYLGRSLWESRAYKKERRSRLYASDSLWIYSPALSLVLPFLFITFYFYVFPLSLSLKPVLLRREIMRSRICVRLRGNVIT